MENPFAPKTLSFLKDTIGGIETLSNKKVITSSIVLSLSEDHLDDLRIANREGDCISPPEDYFLFTFLRAYCTSLLDKLPITRGIHPNMSHLFTKYNFLASYNRILQKYPLTTNMITAGLLAGGGDIICQNMFKNQSQGLNLSRTGRMIGLAVLFTPPTRLWYNFVPKIAEKFVSKEILRPFAITILNQVFFSPPLLASWLLLARYLETGDIAQSVDSMKERVWHGIKASWTVWPFANLVAFSVVPAMHRIFFMNLVAFGWNIFTSWLQHNHIGKEGIENT